MWHSYLWSSSFIWHTCFRSWSLWIRLHMCQTTGGEKLKHILKVIMSALIYTTLLSCHAWWKHSPRSSFRHFISSSMFFAETDGDHEIIRWWLMTEFTHEHTTLHYCSPTAHYNTLHNPTAHYSKIQKVSFVRFAFSKWSFFIEVAVLCGHVISLKSSKLWPRHKADFNRTVTLQSLRCRAPPPTESHQS